MQDLDMIEDWEDNLVNMIRQHHVLDSLHQQVLMSM